MRYLDYQLILDKFLVERKSCFKKNSLKNSK